MIIKRLKAGKVADILPHLAGIASAAVAVGTVSLASSAFHGSTPAKAYERINSTYTVAEKGSSEDIKILLKIAASKALDGNSQVVVAYDAQRICRALLSSNIRLDSSSTILGLATYYPPIDELIVDRQVPSSELRKTCQSQTYRDDQFFVSDRRISLRGGQGVQLNGDLIGIPE